MLTRRKSILLKKLITFRPMSLKTSWRILVFQIIIVTQSITCLAFTFCADSALKKDRRFIAVPVLRYEPETRGIYGLAAMYQFYMNPSDTNNRASALFLSATYTQNKQSEIYFSSDTWSKTNNYHLINKLNLINYPNYFFGI